MRITPVDNPPNPYLSEHREWLEPQTARVEVYEEESGSILSRNTSPDLPFDWSVNPYRGCQHACAYCYARPYHEYLGFGAGTDFDTRLVVKVNAPALLREAFSRRSWRFEPVNFSGVTDCYQPLEAGYGLTRSCLEVCIEFANPTMIVTKGCLVVRDVDVLCDLARIASVHVMMSIPFATAEMSRRIEPQAPVPQRRFETMRRLRESGIDVGVLVAPIIPGLNDHDVAEILARAADAGATCAGYTALRLPPSVEPVFRARIEEAFPLRASRILNLTRDARGGRLDENRFGLRMRGQGPYWNSIRDLFHLTRTRLGLDPVSRETRPANRRQPAEPTDIQLPLFE